MKRDESYRLLFSNPEVVEDMLRGYVSPELSADLDFSTLQRVNASFVSGGLERRESDVVWKLQFKGRTLFAPYVGKFVCFEFHYMDPDPANALTDAAAQQALYADYLSYLESRGL